VCGNGRDFRYTHASGRAGWVEGVAAGARHRPREKCVWCRAMRYDGEPLVMVCSYVRARGGVWKRLTITHAVRFQLVRAAALT